MILIFLLKKIWKEVYRATQPASDWGPVYDKPVDPTTKDSNNQLDSLSFTDPIELRINNQNGNNFRMNNHINEGFLNDNYQDTRL